MWADHNHEIECIGQLVLHVPEGFAEQAFDAISLRGIAHGSGDSQAEATPANGVATCVDHQGARTARLPSGKHRLKVAFVPNDRFARECS